MLNALTIMILFVTSETGSVAVTTAEFATAQACGEAGDMAKTIMGVGGQKVSYLCVAKAEQKKY